MKWILTESQKAAIRDTTDWAMRRQSPRNTQAEKILAYLAANQPLTLGRLVSESGCGCLDRGYETIKRLIKEGKITQDNGEPPLLTIPTG